jgi:hypothetical protein
MTADEPTKEQALAEFRELQRRRGVETLSCPACGADNWGGFDDVALLIIEGRNPKTGEATGTAGSVHALLLGCGRCGFIALFDRDVIGS